MHFAPMVSFEAAWMRYALAKRCGAVQGLLIDDETRGFVGVLRALMMGFGRVAHCGFCYS